MIFIILSFCSSYEVYKKCSDMRFCYHNIDSVGSWTINNPQFNKDSNEFSAKLFNNGDDDDLKLVIYLMQNNSFRIRFLPTNQESFPRYKLSENPIIIDQEIINRHLPLTYKFESGKYFLNSETGIEAEINPNPFFITISDQFNSKLFINYNQNLVFEHKGEKVDPDYWPYYMNDTIKNGATATGIDFSFNGIQTRLTGFSETDESINFEDTKDEPKRFSNFDFYSDYGHVPLIYGHSTSEMISFFWLNPSDTFLQIKSDEEDDMRNVRVLSEGGYVDVVIFTGKIFSILESYTELTGRHEIPPLFSLGYHQSKWGYKTQTEVENVIDEFDRRNFPLDVFWLDVDHLHGHEPFRFNRSAFPNPNELFVKLQKQNRILVRLNDPHLPEDDTHEKYKYAMSHGYFVNKSDGVTPFNAVCWPGSSFWPDFLNPEVRKWWSSLYKYEANETASNVFFWNDMNEPSVFSTVEGTFPKENVYFGGYEEREIRSIYGILMESATHEGVVNRNDDKNQRPFLLTRSYFAGSQKYSWMWSGDNTANYDHLRRSIPMALVAGLCGMPMTGADLGGFNGNTNPQLISRWYQAGSLSYPLFRNHCHEDSEHREPYLFDDATFSLLKDSTVKRYEAAPLFYTAIHDSHKTGIPPVLPLFALYPEIDEMHDIDDQFILGQSLMVAPVLEENAKQKKIVKPPGIWYNLTNGQKLNDWSTVTIDVFNHSLPVFLKGGSILPLFSKVGMNMEQTSSGPIRLVVGCDNDGNANGPLYLDDGKTFNYEKGEFLNRMIVFKNGKIRIEKRDPVESSMPDSLKNTYINEISFFGLKEKPILVSDDAALSCNDDGDQCTMNGFKLYPKDVTPDDDDDDSDDEKISKKLFYKVVAGLVTGCVVLLITVIVLSVILCQKTKKERLIDDDKKNFDTILYDSQQQIN